MTEPAPVTPAPAPSAAPRRSRRTLLVVLIAAGVVLLLLIGVGAWAVANLFLGKNESATASAVAFPASTVSWTEVAIDPSNGQKLSAFEFVNALDGLKDALEDSDLDVDFDDPAANDDLKKSLWEFVVEGDELGVEDISLDYDDDIKPWLGSRVAYGVLPSDDIDEPKVIVAIEASNTDAAIEAMEDLVDDIDADADVSARNGYVLISAESIDLDDEFENGTLADAELFSGARSNAGEWGVLSYWADLGASVAMASELSDEAIGDMTDPDVIAEQIRENPYSYVPFPNYDVELGGYVFEGVAYESYGDYEEAYLDANMDALVDAELEKYEGVAEAKDKLLEQYEGVVAYGVLRFVDGSLELAGSVSGLPEVSAAKSTGEAITALPESTMLALSVSGVGSSIDSALSDENLSLLGLLGAAGIGSTEAIDRDQIADFFDESLGLEFPDDLDVLFGEELVFSVDEDVDLSTLDESEGGDFASLVESGFALTIISEDADETVEAWEDLIARFEDESGTEFGLDVDSEGARVVVSSGDFVDTVLDPAESVRDGEVFDRAVPAAGGSSAVLFIDVERLLDLVGDLGADDDFIGVFEGLEALGASQSIESDDEISYVVRVTTQRD